MFWAPVRVRWLFIFINKINKLWWFLGGAAAATMAPATAHKMAVGNGRNWMGERGGFGGGIRAGLW